MSSIMTKNCGTLCRTLMILKKDYKKQALNVIQNRVRISMQPSTLASSNPKILENKY